MVKSTYIYAVNIRPHTKNPLAMVSPNVPGHGDVTHTLRQMRFPCVLWDWKAWTSKHISCAYPTDIRPVVIEFYACEFSHFGSIMDYFIDIY